MNEIFCEPQVSGQTLQRRHDNCANSASLTIPDKFIKGCTPLRYATSGFINIKIINGHPKYFGISFYISLLDFDSIALLFLFQSAYPAIGSHNFLILHWGQMINRYSGLSL